MGRRSINTTKSGKYMNPTDQARKEARKKELKKNKKQRQMVRQAVLKGKDPAQLLEEMEKIDEMEYNVFQPSPLNEKVLKEKRKKLKETFDRVMRLYHTEDPELWGELKRKEVEYEKRRNKKIAYYESVRHAESVQIDDIPLPSAKETPTPLSLPRIQLPPPTLIIPPVPVDRTLANIPASGAPNPEEPEEDFDEEVLKGPSCPPGPPPDVFVMEDLDSDYDESLLPKNRKTVKFSAETKTKSRDDASSGAESDDDDEVKAPNRLQQKMLALSGQSIDEFMREMEIVQRKNKQERSREAGEKSDSSSDSEKEEESTKPPHQPPVPPTKVPEKPSEPAAKIPLDAIPPPPMSKIPPPPPPVGMIYRFPAGMPLRLAPPPPRHGLPQPPPMMSRIPGGIRMPPGPPPGPPPAKYQQHKGQSSLSAGPQLSKDPKSATITAKPQIRNLSADVTRFVPSTLRIKKDDKKSKPRTMVQQMQPTQAPSGPTKDDAYMQFMKEMEGFL